MTFGAEILLLSKEQKDSGIEKYIFRDTFPAG
jgi:hypothetical protein